MKTTNGLDDSLMTVEDVAAYLAVSRATVYGWRGKHYGPPAMRVGGGVRYRRDEVDRWLELVVEGSPGVA